MPKDRARRLLAANMKRLRALRGYSGDLLAEKADISGNYLRRVETYRSWPTSKVLNRIAKALRVPIHELFLDNRRRD